MAAIDGNTLAISIRQGETVRFNFTYVRESDGTPINITGEKFVLTVKKSAKQTLAPILLLRSDATYTDPAGSNPYDPSAAPTSSSIGVSDGPNGKWRFIISAVKARSLPAGDYVYEIDKIKGDGTVYSLMSGDFTVVPEVG